MSRKKKTESQKFIQKTPENRESVVSDEKDVTGSSQKASCLDKEEPSQQVFSEKDKEKAAKQAKKKDQGLKTKKIHPERNAIIYSVVWVILMVGAVLLLGIGRGADRYTILCECILSFICSFVTVFLWQYGRISKTLRFDAPEHPFRFFGMLMVGSFACILYAILPDTGWMFLAFYILLSMVSNSLTGLCGATTLLISTLFMSGSIETMTFLVYFVAGVMGIALFETVLDTARFAMPLFLSVLIQMVTLLAGEVLFENKNLNLQSFIVPCINLLINAVLLTFALKPMIASIILPRQNLYQTITDPEYVLMKELREVSVNDYFHALHTARLSENICKDCGLDHEAVKAAAYYWKYGKLTDTDQEELMRIHHFPEDAVRIIRQMNRKDNTALTPETTVLMFCDAEVNMMELFADRGMDIHSQYKTLVNKILDRKIESGILNRSKISVMDMNNLRKYLLEDEMYYDFVCSNRKQN